MKANICKYIFIDKGFAKGNNNIANWHMSVLRKLFLLLFCFLFLSTLGCVAFKGTSNKWEESFSNVSESGPGSSDLLFRKWEYNKFKYDDGTRIAIGLFPGAGEKIIDGEFASEDFIEGNTWEGYFTGTIAYQFALALPTISSLFVEPFVDTEYSGYGLVGCHRWSVAPSRKFIKSGPSEFQIVKNGFSSSRGGNFVIGRSKDKVRLYFEYPGGEKIFEEVAENGKVDVLFPNSHYIRRFSKSKRKKFKGVALTYKDYNASEYSLVMKQINHQRDFQRMKNALVKLESSKDYLYADESIKQDMKMLKEDVYSQLASSLPTRENALADVEKEYTIIKDGLMAIALRESQAREEAEVKKFINAQIKRVTELQASQKWNEIIKICNDMLQNEKAKPDEMWIVYKQNAEQEIEKQRLKKIEEERARNKRKEKEIDKLADQLDL